MKVHIAQAALLGSLALLVSACASSSSSGPASSPGSPTAPSTSSTQQASVPPAPSSPQQSATPRAAGPAPCATANLQVKLGAGQGAAGSRIVPIDFTNSGSLGCTLYGYPGVSLAGGNPPAQIGAAAVRDPVSPAKQLTLAPGGTANAMLRVTVAGNYPAATCGPTPATTLVVYPPNQTASVSVPYSATGCSSNKVTILHVTVVQAGSGG